MENLYNKVIETHKAGDENMFAAAAKNWICEAEEAPFEDAEAKELFSKAKRNYRIWKSGAISSRVSKLRMIECVRKIAEKNLPNPYIKPEIAKVNVEPELTKKYVFGVLPESVEAKPVDPSANVVVENLDSTEKIGGLSTEKEKPAEEKKVPDKKLFNRRKRGNRK